MGVEVSSEGKRWTQERFDAEGRQRPLADLWEEAASEVERLRSMLERERLQRQFGHELEELLHGAEAEVERLRRIGLDIVADLERNGTVTSAHYNELRAVVPPEKENS